MSASLKQLFRPEALAAASQAHLGAPLWDPLEKLYAGLLAAVALSALLCGALFLFPIFRTYDLQAEVGGAQALPLLAPATGRLTDFRVHAGQRVESNEPLAALALPPHHGTSSERRELAPPIVAEVEQVPRRDGDWVSLNSPVALLQPLNTRGQMQVQVPVSLVGALNLNIGSELILNVSNGPVPNCCQLVAAHVLSIGMPTRGGASSAEKAIVRLMLSTPLDSGRLVVTLCAKAPLLPSSLVKASVQACSSIGRKHSMLLQQGLSIQPMSRKGKDTKMRTS